MQKGIFAAVLVAALTFVGADAEQAKADRPFYLSVGGPRAGLSIATGGYGYGYGRGGFGGFYARPRPLPAYGVTRGYGRGGYGSFYRPPVAYVPRRACDFGYYGF